MGFKVDEVFVDFIVKFDKGEAGARRINEAMGKLGRVAGVAADATDRTERATRRYGSAARKAASDTKKLGTATKATGGDLKRMIKTMLGLEVARRVIRALLNTFIKFRTAMNNVRAITNATDAQFARLKATAQELGRTTQFTATQAAEAMAFLARTGLDVNQTIGVLPGTLNLAAATAVDLATAADLSTNILKGMGLQIRDLDGLVDILAKTTNSANVNIFELSEAMKEVAPLAVDAGTNVKELAALIGTLGDAGIKGTRAGTALRRMLINLTTGAEGAQEVIDRLGLRIFDASGKFVGISDVIGQLNEKGADATDMFKLFGARGLASAQVLRRTGAPAIEEFTKALDSAGGTAERMAKQQMAGLPGAVKLLQSAAESTAIAWGDALEPAMTAVATVIRVVILPLFDGILASFKLAGIGAFVFGQALLSAMEIAGASVGVAVGFIVEKLGTMIRFVGELGEKFDIFPELSEGLANFGLTMERTGKRVARDGVGIMTEAIDDMGFAWTAASEAMDEVSLEMVGLAGDADETTKAIGKLSTAVDGASEAMQRARTALNLDVFTAQLQAVRDLLRETFGFEGTGALSLEDRLEIQRRLVAMSESQVEGVMDLVAAEQNLANAVTDVLQIQTELNAAGEDQEKIAQLTADLENAVSALAAATLDAGEAMEGLGEKGGKGIGELLGKVSLAIRGINRLADAFGLVNSDVRKAIDSMLDMLQTVKALEAAKGALSLGTVLGFAGAAAGGISAIGGLLGGLFGGKSPEELRREQERIELLRANNLALEQLRLSFEKSLTVLAAFSGAELERARGLLDQQLAIVSGRFQGFENIDIPAALSDVQFAFLESIAESFGLTLDRTVESFRALQTAINDLDLARLTESFTGAMDLMQRRFAIFDIDKPIDRLSAMLGLLEEFGDLSIDLPGIDTEAGRAALEALVRSLFEQIETGEFDISRLGGLTLEDFLNLLAGIEDLLDDIEGQGATADEGLTENFVRTTRITEIQGNELLTLQRNMLVFDRMQLNALLSMVDLLGVMAGIPAPAPAAVASQGAATIVVGGVSVAVTMTVTDEVDVDALIERMGTNLAGVIDRELSEIQTREDRAIGDTGRVA